MKYRSLSACLLLSAAYPQTLLAAEDTPPQLEKIRVTAERKVKPAGASALDADQLRRGRGTGNADIFSALPSVQANNIRNEAGAIDLGIRGLQGEGRVPVVIDGSLQSTHTARGYQGTSDRTYIDSDLITKVSVEEGASNGAFSSGAIGGLVQIRTLGVEDVLRPGKDFGVLLKGSAYNNNKTPRVPDGERDQAYYQLNNGLSPRTFNNGSATLALAYRQPGFDALLAYSKRRTGNYFAGSHGFDGYPEAVVSRGQEVVNTSYESDSLLAKLGFALDDAQRLKLIFRRHRQQAGELLAAYWYKNSNDKNFNELPPGVESMPQWALGSAVVHAYSAQYTFTPSDNRLIDLNLGVWATEADLDQHNGLWAGRPGASYGDQYMHAYNNKRHGFNLLNRSELEALPLSLSYGLAVQQERTQPTSRYTEQPRPLVASRNGVRNERSLFANAVLSYPWARFTLGTNLHGSTTRDYATNLEADYAPKLDLTGQIDVHLAKWLDVYAKGGRAYRMPSLYETTTSSEVFSYNPYNPLRPERSLNLELGLRAGFEDVFVAKEKIGFKASYFDNQVRDYISSAWLESTPGMPWWKGNLTFLNYDKVELRGYEFGFNYRNPSFFVDAAATLYLEPEVCSASQASRRKASNCNDNGFEWSLIPTRIPPRSQYVISAGKYLLDGDLTVGGRWRYHSAKTNPAGWLQGTGARPVLELASERLVDLFIEYRLNKQVNLNFNVDNLTNRYAVDPGSVISMPIPGRTIRMGMEARF
ncbi:TonB-dependent receptor [Chromobacterium alkanivorans]|uniref:TonB-dependent receptor domain-containing protein n=1 Tax=Chromobacterium alkanivorans TaxID=1071719 RepID=UPI0019683475|nr:TonB-dependent receptor [Chromobacterium alkanivorans]MBN3002240.1 TonB-dependent receptor [Chromobacterium alkanivorans]